LWNSWSPYSVRYSYLKVIFIYIYSCLINLCYVYKQYGTLIWTYIIHCLLWIAWEGKLQVPLVQNGTGKNYGILWIAQWNNSRKPSFYASFHTNKLGHLIFVPLMKFLMWTVLVLLQLWSKCRYTDFVIMVHKGVLKYLDRVFLEYFFIDYVSV